MGAFLVIDRDPFVGDFSNLIQVFKQIGIQDLLPIGSVEPFDKGVLAGFTGLDVSQLNAFVLAPLKQRCIAQLRTII
jgi:hypothetical protein